VSEWFEHNAVAHLSGTFAVFQKAPTVPHLGLGERGVWLGLGLEVWLGVGVGQGQG